MSQPNARTVRLAIIEADARIDAAKAARIRTAADRKLDEHIAATRAETARITTERKASAAKRRAMQAKRRTDAADPDDTPLEKPPPGPTGAELQKRVAEIGPNRLVVMFASASSTHFPDLARNEAVTRKVIQERARFATWILAGAEDLAVYAETHAAVWKSRRDWHRVLNDLIEAADAVDEMARNDNADIPCDERDRQAIAAMARRSAGR